MAKTYSTTIRFPADMKKELRAVGNINEFVVAAVRSFLRKRRELEIDRAFEESTHAS